MTRIRPILYSFSVIGAPVSSQAHKSKEIWKTVVGEAAKTCVEKPLQIGVRVDLQIDWFSHGSRNKPDVDNILKPILDALKGLLYVDDNQVSSVTSRHNDTDSVLHFIEEPIQIIEPLLSGNKEYIYIRAYSVP